MIQKLTENVKILEHIMSELACDFIQFAIDQEVLHFGEYQLKSGRVSPYFFNAGGFNSGAVLAKLGRLYARAIVDSGVEFDMLFGPAYKGIPLVAATSIALAEQHGRDIPYAFNRKEKKRYGEGGDTVGADLSGRIMIVDDVITAGTAVRDVMTLLEGSDRQVVAIVVALDRQEKGRGELSAVQELEQEFAIPVIAIAGLNQLIDFLAGQAQLARALESVKGYRDRYGADYG